MASAETAVFTPNSTSFAIMKLVHGYFSSQRKSWTLMDQRWMLDKLAGWYGVKISRSTLNYNLAILRKHGLIDTVTRHQRDPKTGEFVCKVTLYKVTKGLKRFFSKLASYYKRCKWVPSLRQLKAGVLPVVGTATSREEAHKEYVRLRKELKSDGSPRAQSVERQAGPGEDHRQRKMVDELKQRDDRVKVRKESRAGVKPDYLVELEEKYCK